MRTSNNHMGKPRVSSSQNDFCRRSTQTLGKYAPVRKIRTNTFAGKLTQPMFDAVFARARVLAG